MKSKLLWLVVLSVVFLFGGVVEKKTNVMSSAKHFIYTKIVESNKEDESWSHDFKEVKIKSSKDESLQKAMFLPAIEKAPLIISLHTWVGDYKEFDPLSDKALEANWNYIHPDFRGPNWTNDACLSENAISDIDDAISYALEKGNVDLDNIFVVGVSGGGYATLGTYIKTKYKINTFISWVPISDLGLWYKQNRDRGNKYANDIISCTSSNGVFDRKLTDLRSPLQWELPESQGNIEIYAGIDDGHSGPVPVSHSILFFNKLAAMHDHNNVITTEESILLIDRLLPLPDKINTLDGRDILFEKHAGPASIYFFDGNHEMLGNYTFNRLVSLLN